MTLRPCRLAAAVTIATLATAAPAAAQDGGLPLQLVVTVVPPSDVSPRPTGRIVVSAGGRELVSVPLVPGLEPLTAITPQISALLAVVGGRVTVSYSGDSNYEASDGIVVTTPTRRIVTITIRRRDSAAPAIEILSPGDGVTYERGEEVVAIYSCRDPGDRSTVTTCDGPVAAGSAVTTRSAGTFSFAVRSADALGNATSRTVTYTVADASNSGGPTTGSGAVDSAGRPPAPPAARAPRTAQAPPSAIVRRPGAVARVAARPARHRIDAKQRTGPSARAAPGGAAPAGASSRRAAAGSERPELTAYELASEPAKAIGILVAAFTLLQLGTHLGGGLARAGGGGGVATPHDGSGGARGGDGGRSSDSFELDHEGADVAFLGAGLGAMGLGDRSRTWSWPGTRRLDALGATVPPRLARPSPLLARVTADGTYLRAILGSLSLLTMLGGLALGVLALQDTGGEALPPAAVLTIAIAALGVLDAAAGLLAVLIFSSGVLLAGGVSSTGDVRLMLGLGALWFIVPVLAGATRPLRRAPVRDLPESWDRAADFVIASLVGAWVVQRIVVALPGLADAELPIAEHADAAALCVLAALVLRLGLETIAAHLYPRRLDVTEAGRLPEPGALQRLGASAFRTAIFVFVARIVAGDSWQLWVGAALFVIPQVLALYAERFPNSPTLYRALPKGWVELVLMLFVATAVGALLLRTMDERSETFLADAFVLLALPGFLLSLVQLFGRDGEEPPLGWGRRIAGVAVLVAGVLVALGLAL